jgi:hypothetical protein
VPHNDHTRHGGENPPRPFEHKLAGGNHRDQDGCLGAFFALVGIGVTAVTGIGYGIAQAIL